MEIGPFDLRFAEFFHELYALQDYIDSIESQLPDLIIKEKKKAHEKLSKLNYEDDPFEYQAFEREAYELVEDVLPRYFRNPIIVTLWAIFESGIIEIAKEVKDQRNLPISLKDINGDFLERTNKYFNHVIEIPIEIRGKSWQQIRTLYLLRNAIAHCNGRVENIRNDSNRKKIEQLESKGISTINGNVMCSPDFINESHKIVLEFLTDLTEIVRSKYPNPKNW